MNPSVRSILLGFVVLFGVCARVATYKAPLLDHHGWRQADTAAIARNFARERFNILYPAIDQRGNQPTGYVETGLELFAFLVAAISLPGEFHAETGRVLSTLFFVPSCLLVWTFVRRRYGDEAALVASYLHAFAFPLLLFIERAFMNEALLICLSIGCLVSAQRYLETKSSLALVTLIAVSSTIAAVKLPYLIIWAPIAGLFIERDGWRAWRRSELAAMALINLAVAATWYAHAHRLGAATGLSFGLTDKLFDADTVFSIAYPLRILDRLFRDILEPVGFAAVTAGVWLAVRNRRWCEILGVFGFLAYLVIVAVGNNQHDYYQLALMPMAAVLAGPGLISLAETLAERLGRRRETTMGVLLGVAALCTLVRLASAHSWFEYSPADVVMCEDIRGVSAPDDRVVFIGDNNPQMLFCIDRKGWVLTDAESDERRVRDAWQGGARLAILPRALQRPDVRALLSQNGPPILSNQTLEVYRLP